MLLLLCVAQEQAGVGDNGLPCSIVSVRESDFEVFEALAVDSVSTGEEKYKGQLSWTDLKMFLFIYKDTALCTYPLKFVA